MELVNGRPELHLRFLVTASNEAAENEQAETAVRRLVRDLKSVADCDRWVLKRGPGRNWRYLTSNDAATK